MKVVETDVYDDEEGEEAKGHNRKPVKEVEEVGTKPIDGKDPLIYSNKVAIPPYSFMDHGYTYNKKAPPPCYISHDVLAKPKATKRKDILYGLETNKDGVLQ